MPRRPVTLTSLVASYLEAMRDRNCSDETVRSYGNTLRLFTERYEKITNRGLTSFLRRYTNPQTRNKALAHIRAFANWYGKVDGLVERLRVPPSHVPDSMPIVIADEHSDKLLESLREHNYTAWSIVTILRATGMRMGEVMGLTTSNLQSPSGANYSTVRFYGKGNREREVPLTSAALEAVRYWTSLSPRPSHYTIRRAIAAAEQQAGVAHVTPKNFRSTVASKLVNQGEQVESVADLLGHKSSDMIRNKYARSGHARLKTLVDKI